MLPSHRSASLSTRQRPKTLALTTSLLHIACLKTLSCGPRWTPTTPFAHSKPKLLRDATSQIEWVLDACASSEKSLRQRLASGDKRKIDRPEMKNLHVRNGDYYVKGRPVILTGIGSPWRDDIRYNYGFNGFTAFEFSNGSEARATADRALKAGVSVDLFAALGRLYYPSNLREISGPWTPTGFERRRNVNVPDQMFTAHQRKYSAVKYWMT